MNLRELERVTEAKETLNKALKAYEKNLGEGESDTIDTMLKLSQIHLSLGELKEGQELLEKALFNDLKLVENHVFIDSELTLKARNREVAFKDVPFYNYQRLEGKSTTTLKMVFFFMLQLPKKIRIWKSNV